MGKLIKNHLARLVILASASYQLIATIQAFVWPKIFFDFSTKTMDVAVKPFPVLQIISTILALGALGLEWPAFGIGGTSVHRSMETRFALYPFNALVCMLLYQCTDAALYYLIGLVLYTWAFMEGEVICAKPWSLPPRRGAKTATA